VLDGNDAGYGVVSERQLAWFRAVLARSVARGERVICFCHFALLKEAARDHRMAKPEPLLEALDRAGCVVAWFAGHDHAGGYAVRNGVHHVTIKGMVEAPDENAYAFIELCPEHLREIGLGAECNRQMEICLDGWGMGEGGAKERNLHRDGKTELAPYRARPILDKCP
jgi:manganese-dependent ADP-ribose/CDP-alcohol diphosphatase